MRKKKGRSQARKNGSRGQAPSTEAGTFVREGMRQRRRGRRTRSRKQAVAIGLSRGQARRDSRVSKETDERFPGSAQKEPVREAPLRT